MRAALAAWGLGEAPVAPVPEADAAAWRVAAAPGYLLRRYAASEAAAAAALAYQHAMLTFLADDAWPVLAPVRAADGATLVEAEGARWALFPAPAGAQPPDRPIFVQRRGALLALLHHDLASWGGVDAAGAFPRLDDLYAIAVARGHASFDALLARVEAADAARAAQLASLGDRNADMLMRLGYDDLPEVATWGGCTAPHVLFEGDDVTALLDFDGARPDARIADIGASLLVEAERDDGWRVLRWVAGYAAHADPPLTEDEVGLLPTVMTALAVRRAVDALAAAAEVDAPALATVDAAMAAEAAQRDLRRVIRTAAGLPPR